MSYRISRSKFTSMYIPLFLLLLPLALGYEFDTGLNDLLSDDFLYDSPVPRDLLFNNNSTGLQEFQPIKNTIVQSETQYYSFRVDSQETLGSYYQLLIFLTGNICNEPDNMNIDDTSIAVYYSFNGEMFENLEFGQKSLFENGYFQTLVEVPADLNANDDDPNNDFSILYIAVRAPENVNRTAKWSYQIGVSQKDLVFQWDNRSWAELIDTDSESALITTGNLTNSANFSLLDTSTSQYSLFIYSYDYLGYFDKVNSSWCAVRQGPALIKGDQIISTYTNRLGSLQQQFYVSGLNSSTKYIAYLLSDFKGNTYGGALYYPFEFETMANDGCELIYDLEFCDGVSYSVPSSSRHSKDELKFIYDQQAESYYQNFTKALNQVACNTTRDAEFSPMKTCEDCARLYKSWLCSVTIPRCSTRNQTGYLHREVSESRGAFINDDISPDQSYYEILPCIDVCNTMVRDCPAQLGFACPTSNQSIAKSYYWWDGDAQWPSCNKLALNLISGTPKNLPNLVLFFVSLAIVIIV